MITKDNTHHLRSVHVSVSSLLSDHLLVHCKFECRKPHLQKRFVTYRKVNRVNLADFCSDLSQPELLQNVSDSESSLDAEVNMYNAILVDLLDKRAPAKTRSFTDRPRIP